VTETWSSIVAEAIGAAPERLDLRDARKLDRARDTAQRFLSACPSLTDLDQLETSLLERRNDVPLLVHLAVKLARSKRMVERIDLAWRQSSDTRGGPLRISVVFAMYREHERILTPDMHPHGEDFFIRKLEQLEWLLGDLPSFTWHLIAVDDGCPHASGRVAQEILAERAPSAPVRVLFLEDGIRDGVPAIATLQSAEESLKGASIQLGMWRAATENGSQDHIIAYTDADLSTHLGQLGLLIDPIVRGTSHAAIGSRRQRESVVVKSGERDERGQRFIELWKQMLPLLGHITDTQCGFKAWRADIAAEILPDLLEHQFAFDVELLIKTELRRPGSVACVPIAWIDSEAASTTSLLDPYLRMLKSIAAMYRRYLPSEAAAEEVAGLVERAEAAEEVFG
jgi:hypothetical protein